MITRTYYQGCLIENSTYAGELDSSFSLNAFMVLRVFDPTFVAVLRCFISRAFFCSAIFFSNASFCSGKKI